MLVLVFLGGGLLLGLVLLAILGFGLVGQLRRLKQAVEAAQADLRPALDALRGPSPSGRHRAD